MTAFAIRHPVATVSRGIEDLVIKGLNSKSYLMKGACAVLSRVISLTVFPIFLLLELTFSRIPKALLAIGNSEKFHRKLDKAAKYFFAIFTSPLGLHSPEGVSGFFLKTPPSHEVRPFGVEAVYGQKVDQITYPKSILELQQLVRQAKEQKKQISIMGAGMSQGTQTVPHNSSQIVICLKHLNSISLAPDGQTAQVQAGATWEQLQIALNNQGKSSIVKQASDIFSIGGSIGINCHGWAHEYGALSSTVESLEIIDASGEFRRLSPADEQFRCMFGTLGYFGIVVSASLKVTDNVPLIQKATEIHIDDFHAHYQE